MFLAATELRVLRSLSRPESRIVSAPLDWLSSRDCKKPCFIVSHSASQQGVQFLQRSHGKDFFAKSLMAEQKSLNAWFTSSQPMDEKC